MREFPGPALLFCPADRPERFAKAAAAADAVILDLEDGVAPADREEARRAVVATPLDPRRVIVRLNAFGTADHARDVAMLRTTPYRTVMLAKTESAAQVSTLADSLGPGRDVAVVALCETARGVLAATEIALLPATIALMWGAEDLVVSLGGRSSRNASGDYREVARHARATVLLAAGAQGKAAIDAVHLDLADEAGLRDEAEDAAGSGFAATACIHPVQVPVVRAAYLPSDADVDAARSLLHAAQGQPGVFAFEGRMVDEPVLRQARRVLRAAGVSHPDPP